MNPRIQHQEGQSAFYFNTRMHSLLPQLPNNTNHPYKPLSTTSAHHTPTHNTLQPARILSSSPSLLLPCITNTLSSPITNSVHKNQHESERRCFTEGSVVEQEMIEIQSLGLEESFLEELQCLEGLEWPQEGLIGEKTSLQSLLVQEAQSLRLDASSLSQDEYSQAVTLTEEERIFFNNFPQAVKLADSLFRNVTVQDRDTVKLQHRKRLIRNFFRPKGSFVKDDRTCCNSCSHLDSLAESKQGSPVGSKVKEGQKRPQ